MAFFRKVKTFVAKLKFISWGSETDKDPNNFPLQSFSPVSDDCSLTLTRAEIMEMIENELTMEYIEKICEYFRQTINYRRKKLITKDIRTYQNVVLKLIRDGANQTYIKYLYDNIELPDEENSYILRRCVSHINHLVCKPEQYELSIIQQTLNNMAIVADAIVEKKDRIPIIMDTALQAFMVARKAHPIMRILKALDFEWLPFMSHVAALNYNVKVLVWLQTDGWLNVNRTRLYEGCKHFDKNCKTLAYFAAKSGHLNLIKWAIRCGYDYHAVRNDVYEGAIRGGHLHILTYLMMRGYALSEEHIKYLIQVANACYQTDISRWLTNHFGTLETCEKQAEQYVMNNDLHGLQIMQTNEFTLGRFIYRFAIKYKKENILQWLLENDYIWTADDLFYCLDFWPAHKQNYDAKKAQEIINLFKKYARTSYLENIIKLTIHKVRIVKL